MQETFARQEQAGGDWMVGVIRRAAGAEDGTRGGHGSEQRCGFDEWAGTELWWDGRIVEMR
jgi:hypothetical protein